MSAGERHRGPWSEAAAEAAIWDERIRSANFSAFVGWSVCAIAWLILAGDHPPALAVAGVSAWCALGRFRGARPQGPAR